MTKRFKTKIVNSAGFWLLRELYHEHPQFANADGWIEILSPDTAILRIISLSVDDDEVEDSQMMRLFLDFAIAKALKNNTLQPYTTEMSEAARKLIDGLSDGKFSQCAFTRVMEA